MSKIQDGSNVRVKATGQLGHVMYRDEDADCWRGFRDSLLLQSTKKHCASFSSVFVGARGLRSLP
jgi:hypothetical protein